MLARLRSAALLMCTVVVTTIAIAGCEGKGDGDPPAAPAAPAPPTGDVSSLRGQTLTVWMRTPSAAMQELIKAFETESGAKLNIINYSNPDEVTQKWNASQRPDILQQSLNPRFLRGLRPADTLVDLSGQPFVQKTKYDIYDHAGSADGKVYEVTIDMPAVYAMHFNRDVFRRLNLQIPTNLQELLQTCNAIKAADPSVAPIFDAGGDAWPTQILPGMFLSDAVKEGFFKDVLARKARLGDKPVVEALEAYKSLQDNGCFNKDLKTATIGDELSALLSGKAAMAALLVNFAPRIQERAGPGAPPVDKTYGFFSLSLKGPIGSYGYECCGTFAVPKSNPEKERAGLLFVNWITGPYYDRWLKTSAQMPVLEGYSAPATVSPLLVEAEKNVLNNPNSVPNFEMVLGSSIGSFETFLGELISGTKSPEEVAQSLQRAFELQAKASGLPGF